MKLTFKPGNLVRFRERDWVVQPHDSDDVLLLKPLGGNEEEITGIFLPLQAKLLEKVEPTDFPKPTSEDLGNFESAKLLYNANRLSLRSASGPFRSLGRLSFRPRSYQMVPLIMALRQDTVRLLIADDVGVGKTIEALLIARELLDRGEIKRFAILCLPHLCEQWQEELKNKFGIEAVIIRSGTIAKLERQLRNDEILYRKFPFQVISIEYVKAESHKRIFLDHIPEFIIVDEVHTCAMPAGATAPSQQQRFHLLHEISQKQKQHLLLLTATPHSGKQEEFQSLLGLLKSSFKNTHVAEADETKRKEIARHFVQRRRIDVEKWLGEDTPFPDRISAELAYALSKPYADFFEKVLKVARKITQTGSSDIQIRGNYFAALALLRGVMSSPAVGYEMFSRKLGDDNDFTEVFTDENPVLDADFYAGDVAPVQVTEYSQRSVEGLVTSFKSLANECANLMSLSKDTKAKTTLEQLSNWLKKGINPIVFCRYIATANYLGKVLTAELKRQFPHIEVEVITSELADEQRRERIDEIGNAPLRVLIATDCLSEGVNLQAYFSAILHYDLPWNPNRLEQREGRIDRFGQLTKEVFVMLLYGSDNPIDSIVLEVLLRKAKEIRKATGISVPFPEDSRSIMDAVLNKVLLNDSGHHGTQMALDFGSDDTYQQNLLKVSDAYQKATKLEKASRSIFAQNAIKAQEIEDDLKEVDQAIGNVEAVQNFVIETLRFLGVQVKVQLEGFLIFTQNIPARLRGLLSDQDKVLISFLSPTPQGYHYLGRNHLFVEQLCQYLLTDALEKRYQTGVARASVVRTGAVLNKTTLVQFRVRNVISEVTEKQELVAEELLVWGYEGDVSEQLFLEESVANRLLMETKAAENVELGEQMYWLNEELEWINKPTLYNQITDPIAITRANALVEAHERFRRAVGSGNKFRPVEPVLPMDVIGVYILLPEL